MAGELAGDAGLDSRVRIVAVAVDKSELAGDGVAVGVEADCAGTVA
jgi:hypothetical protein